MAAKQVIEDYPDDSFIVICRTDRPSPRRKGHYVLATRRTFATRAEADAYQLTVAKGRQAIVVAGRWHQLRKGDQQ